MTRFLKRICYGSFRYVSTLRTKVFWRAPVKYFSICVSNNSDSAAFENAAFGDIQDHSWKKTPFWKKNCFWSFRLVSTLLKTYFQEDQWSAFLFVTHNSDSFIFGNAPFGEIKHHSLKARSFQKTFAMQVLGMCLSYGKSDFQEHQWSAFLFMAQITQIMFVFRSAAFGDIKDHSLRTILFQ